MYRVISSDNLRGETLGEIRILITVYPSISTTKFLNKMVEIKGKKQKRKNKRKTHFYSEIPVTSFGRHSPLDDYATLFPTFTNTNPALENECFRILINNGS